MSTIVHTFPTHARNKNIENSDRKTHDNAGGKGEHLLSIDDETFLAPIRNQTDEGSSAARTKDAIEPPVQLRPSRGAAMPATTRE